MVVPSGKPSAQPRENTSATRDLCDIQSQSEDCFENEDLEMQEKCRDKARTSHSDDSHDEEAFEHDRPKDTEEKPKGATRAPNRKQRHKRIVDLYAGADWWSLWIGLISFSLAVFLVFVLPFEKGTKRVRYVVPQPMKWTTNPLNAWDLYGIIGSLILLVVLCSLYLLSTKCMGKLDKQPTWKYTCGFAVMSILATVSFWIGRNEWCSSNGLGYAIFSILFGIIIRNTPLGKSERLKWLLLTSKDGEFFIKCSLVLLAVEFSVLRNVGLPAIAVAWIGSPLALIAGYLLGAYVFKMERSIALLVAVGATWCGASAISAIGSIIGAKSIDMALSISVVAFFTIAFTFAQPYFALGVGMDDAIAGAWIGGSVDQTGNVVAAAAIISEEATEVAGVVKIILNSGLGLLAAVISLCWNPPAKVSDEGFVEVQQKRKFDPLVVWDKFPKFVLGFLLCSGVLTAVRPRIEGTAEGDALQPAVASMNKWWFAIAFVGIGLETDIGKMWQGAIKSGVIKLYLVANTVDIGLALGLAYALF